MRSGKTIVDNELPTMYRKATVAHFKTMSQNFAEGAEITTCWVRITCLWYHTRMRNTQSMTNKTDNVSIP